MTHGGEILVVEDEPLCREVVVRVLTERGYGVETADDAPAGMEWLEQRTPDLVLVDVTMPGLSGLDLVRWIRRHDRCEHLPVILISALIDSADMVAGLEAGADDYIVKPVNPALLLACVSACLRRKRTMERRLEAERNGVELEALGRACEQMSEPVATAIRHLTGLIGAVDPEDGPMLARLREALECTGEVGDLIEKYRKLASQRAVPYTQGIGGLVSATLTAGRTQRDG